MDYPGACKVLLGCGEYYALPDRALYRQTDRTLFLADVHLGKASIFQRSGLNVPEGHVGEDLARLEKLICVLGVQRLIILGDWIHGRLAEDSPVVAEITRFREATRGVDCFLLTGNHDRGIERLFDLWEMNPLTEGVPAFGVIPFHVPPGSAMVQARGLAGLDIPILSGHLHPAVRLRAPSGERFRLPCFLQTAARHCILPAFGSFTGGALVEPGKQAAVFAIFEDRVLQAPQAWIEMPGRRKGRSSPKGAET